VKAMPLTPLAGVMSAVRLLTLRTE
jgi:hypothetical protein